MAGGLVKTISMLFVADPGDAYKTLDDLSTRSDALRDPVTMTLTADTAPAQAGIDEVTAAFDRYMEASLEATRAAERFAKIQDDNAADSDIYRKALDETTLATDRAADAQIRLAEAEAKAADGAKASGDADVVAAGKADAAADSTEAAAGKMRLSGMALFGVAAGIGAIGYESIKGAIDFQRSQEMIVTEAGVTQKQLAGLSDRVLSLAGQVGFGPESLSEALYHVESSFHSTGISAARAMQLLKTGAEEAKIGGADLTDTQNALDAAIVAGLPGIRGFGQAAGAMLAIVGSGDMSMQDLASAMGSGAIAQAKLYGQSIYQVGAALATLGDNNIRGAKAATDLRMAWQAMESPLSTAGPELHKLGLTTTTLANTMTHHGLSQAVGELIGRLKSSKVPMADWGQYVTDIFGKKAGVAIGLLMKQFDRYESKFPELEKSAHGFGTAWERTKQTVGVEMDQIGASLESVGIVIGTKILPPAEKFFGFIAAHRSVALGMAAAIGGIVLGLTAFTIAAKGAEVVLGILDVEMDANPFGIAVVAIAALAVGMIELYKHSAMVRTIVGDVGRFFAAGWKDAMKLAGDAITWFDNGPLKFIHQEIGQFSQWWAANQKQIMAVVGPVWSFIKSEIVDNVKVAFLAVKVAVGMLVSIWQGSFDVIWNATKIVFDAIALVIKVAITTVEDAITIGLDVIHGHWSAAWNTLLSLTHSVMGDIRSFIGAAVGDFGQLLFGAGQALVGGLIGGIKSALGNLASFLGGIGSFIASHKGPLPADAVLLYPHGRAIIGGLIAGMASMRPELDAHLRGVSAAISGGTGGGGSFAGAGGYGGLELTARVAGGGDPLVTELMRLIRLEVRKKGGTAPDSVQRTFGKV